MKSPEVVSVRIPPGILRMIVHDVSTTDEFASRSDWIQEAIRFYLNHRIQTGAIRRDSVGGGATLTHNAKIFHIFFYV